MAAPADDARERVATGRPGQFKATHSRDAEVARLNAALSAQQNDARASRLADVRRIAMEALLGSGNQNDVEEEVEVEDDEEDGPDAEGMDVDSSQRASGKRMQRLRRLHRTLFFARQLQMPDWMILPPADLASSWMVLARPEGERCLLLSDGGRVEIRRKNGYVQERYTDSRFPRGLTILDVVCIEGPPPASPPASTAPADEAPAGMADDDEDDVEDEDVADAEDAAQSIDADMGEAGGYGKASGKQGRGGRGKGRGKGSGKGRRSRPQGNRSYAVCDVLVWGDVDLAGAEAECRLYWLESRFEEMREKHPRRARPLKLVRALPATPESVTELYREDVGYVKDSLMFLHRFGHYQVAEPITPLALMWRDRTLSRFVVDTPDEKGQDVPQRQAMVLEVRGGGRLRTADRFIVGQCTEEQLAAAQGLAAGASKAKALVRCEVQTVDVANRCLGGVVPVAHVPARSRVWPDSWGRIVFQHLHRDGKAECISFERLLQAAAGVQSSQ
eukprot:gb/GFBE01063225.1/.p1 GENE.gb/GFBE01063225.1/~~gb/GFBE01063225.1/.p1  ORF type:complete len:503 (+),score=110.39 gb/GFBE01063225.1/:1-1509(+)